MFDEGLELGIPLAGRALVVAYSFVGDVFFTGIRCGRLGDVQAEDDGLERCREEMALRDMDLRRPDALAVAVADANREEADDEPDREEQVSREAAIVYWWLFSSCQLDRYY